MGSSALRSGCGWLKGDDSSIQSIDCLAGSHRHLRISRSLGNLFQHIDDLTGPTDEVPSADVIARQHRQQTRTTCPAIHSPDQARVGFRLRVEAVGPLDIA